MRNGRAWHHSWVLSGYKLTYRFSQQVLMGNVPCGRRSQLCATRAQRRPRFSAQHAPSLAQQGGPQGVGEFFALNYSLLLKI